MAGDAGGRKVFRRFLDMEKQAGSARVHISDRRPGVD